MIYLPLLASLKKCQFFHLGFHIVINHDLLVSDGVGAEVGNRSTLPLGRLKLCNQLANSLHDKDTLKIDL